MSDQILVVVVLLTAGALFVTERLRFDIVALLALLTLTLAGVVDPSQAFAGFGHPAVVSVAAILVTSAGLAASGFVDQLARLALRAGGSRLALVSTLTALVTVTSAFMNNVGALALFLPVAIRTARQSKIPVAVVLMPLAFGSLLGGMTTLVGTPPNLIVSQERARLLGEPYRMFDFAGVGGGIAVIGVAFIGLLGWRLLPIRGSGAASDLHGLQEYTVELGVPPDARIVGHDLQALRTLSETEVIVVALERSEQRLLAPPRTTRLAAGDVLVAEVDPRGLEELLAATGLTLAGAGRTPRAPVTDLGKVVRSDDVALVEAVVTPTSIVAGRTPVSIGLRDRHGLNLLAVSRRGARVTTRLRDTALRAGDVVLAQCHADTLDDTMGALGLLPLADRSLGLAGKRTPRRALAIFAVAVAALAAGLAGAEVVFVAAAVAMVLSGVLTLRDAYRAIEWPVIVLLAAMIGVGGALDSSGAAETLADLLVSAGGGLPVWAMLALVLAVTMSLSDVMNNAATAVIMAPIAVRVAQRLEAAPDAFLMAVAVGASAAFLTPIGHQSNTLVMGPGGYRFGDYWRMGLPLELLILAMAVPLLMWVWM